MEEHRCVHGRVVSTFTASCAVGHGMMGWKTKGNPNICPYQWYQEDCSKYEYNKRFHHKEGI